MDNIEIEEMFQALGPVTIRRMFGGKGVYHMGRIVAVEVSGEILLKADDVSAPEFEAAGARRWAYEGRKDKPVSMPYWSIPDDAFDDPDIMARWARLAYEAAVRAEK
ncbi:TfoX/Sxy family protein [Rhizobium jaguaris]|uniref:TfoX family protein n=1 Tax=Rhizobium jaguaris TaxID=1312183 RepID=A0A387FLH4_9HYPH|nr:TfoX/Sxy family protein [Rhizobium jaguaris]AYG59269.1 TfoX family protein [Rhizobium jaguaris]